jgi:hypothetical protein
MSRDSIQTLFSNQPLEYVKSQAKEDILRDIREDNPLYGMEGTLEEKLLKKYRIPIAKITSRKSRVTTDHIEYVISIGGANGTFFHYNPTKQASVTRPSGDTISDTVYLYFDNSGDAVAIKQQIKEKEDALDVWYELVKAEVEEFNKTLPHLIEEAITQNQERLKREKELEDELNS